MGEPGRRVLAFPSFQVGVAIGLMPAFRAEMNAAVRHFPLSRSVLYQEQLEQPGGSLSFGFREAAPGCRSLAQQLLSQQEPLRERLLAAGPFTNVVAEDLVGEQGPRDLLAHGARVTDGRRRSRIRGVGFLARFGRSVRLCRGRDWDWATRGG